MGSFNHVLGLILYYTLASLAALLISPVIAVSVNITVDDTFGNNTFPPMTLDQSWHYAVYDSDAGTPLQVHVTFPGTAVYVYNVLPNTLPTGAIDSNISFALDGETVGTFVRLPDSSSDFLYHQLVYANASLSDTVHTLVMSASGSEPSLLFFDYLFYTTEAALEGTTSDSATAPVPVTSSPAWQLSLRRPAPPPLPRTRPPRRSRAEWQEASLCCSSVQRCSVWSLPASAAAARYWHVRSPHARTSRPTAQ